MVVTDVFALPVEGTETRVNAAAEGYEFMVEYMTKAKEVGLAKAGGATCCSLFSAIQPPSCSHSRRFNWH
jgi:hypothetical protein